STGTGRWALLAAPAPPAEDDVTEAKARQYVKRYGVVFRDLLQRESDPPAWRDLLRVYRRLEMRGELRGGRIVGGVVGEQLPAPQALGALRAIRPAQPRGGGAAGGAAPGWAGGRPADPRGHRAPGRGGARRPGASRGLSRGGAGARGRRPPRRPRHGAAHALSDFHAPAARRVPRACPA